jgi:hypothetical protein
VRKLRLRKGFWITLPALLLAFFAFPVNASTYNASIDNRDFYFTSQEPMTLTIRTYAQQYGIDSMLWVYDEQNTLITANDDWFGLDSFVSFQMTPNVNYRLRAGVCCGDPERWYGNTYVIEPSMSPTNAPETTTSLETTTTIAPFLNEPRNVVVTSVNESKVYLSWDEPNVSNTPVERYAIFFSNDDWQSGFAISSNTTSVVVENLQPDTEYKFKIRSDNDSLSVYSGWSQEVGARTSPLPTTTTTTEPPATTTTTSTTTTTTTIAPVVVTTTSTTTTTLALVTTTTQPVATTLPVQTTVPVITTVPATTTTTTVPTSGVDEEVLETISNISNLNPVAIVNAVNNIINNGVSEQEAVLLSTQPEVLNSISTDQAKEIFASIDVSTLSQQEEKALVEALSDAPSDIKKEFENEIDIFGSGLDEYVPTGSSIDVGARRALIAVTTVATSITMTAPSSGGASSSSSGGSGASTDRSSSRSRRN